MSDIDMTKIRQLDFTLLLILQGLIRHRRTIDVAEELGLSQPAISHALSRLRYLFDDPLFVRQSHGLAPTQHTLALVPYLDSMLHQASTAIGLAAKFDPATTIRNFRIGIPEHLGSMLAGPLLRKMEQVAPRAQFTMRMEIGSEALQNVEHHQLEIAIGQFREARGQLTVSPVYKDRYILVSRLNHPLIKTTVTKALFGKLSHVVVSPTGESTSFADESAVEDMLRRRIVATVPRFHSAFEVVRHSDAVTIAPERLARVYAKTFELTLSDLPVKLRPIRIISARRLQPDPGIDWLIELIEDLFQEM